LWWRAFRDIITSVETIPGMGIGGIKENDGEGEFNYDIRTLVNVTIYLQYNNMIIKNKFKRHN
jgi:hypothetical protein